MRVELMLMDDNDWDAKYTAEIFYVPSPPLAKLTIDNSGHDPMNLMRFFPKINKTLDALSDAFEAVSLWLEMLSDHVEIAQIKAGYPSVVTSVKWYCLHPNCKCSTAYHSNNINNDASSISPLKID